MDTEAEKLIELEVRRRIAEEATRYREGLHRQFTYALGLITVVAVVALTTFYFNVGKSSDEVTQKLSGLDKRIEDSVKRELMALKVEEAAQKKIQDLARDYLIKRIQSDEFSKEVEAATRRSVQPVVEKLTVETYNLRIKESVERVLTAKEQVEKKSATIEGVLKRYVDANVQNVVRYGGAIALKAHNGLYVGTAEKGGRLDTGRENALRQEAFQHETFVVEPPRGK